MAKQQINISQLRSELQQQVDAHMSKQLANSCEQISKMLRAAQARIELSLREALQQVATVPQVQETQEQIQGDTAEISDEPLPILKAIAQTTPPKAIAALDADGWLSVGQAYELGLAQEHGYEGSKRAFGQLSDAGFKKLGFEANRLRRIPYINPPSRWLRVAASGEVVGNLPAAEPEPALAIAEVAPPAPLS